MRVFIVILLLVVVGIGIAGFALGWFNFSTSSNEGKRNLTVTVDQEQLTKDRDKVLALFQSSRDKYQQQADTDLKAMDLSLAELMVKAKNGRAVTKDSMKEAIADLNKKTETAREELRELKNANAENWDALKNHFGGSMTALQLGYERASKQFMVEVASSSKP